MAGISIHAPREGCDQAKVDTDLTAYISIHAPREGCDISAPYLSTSSMDFNPRTPRGVRRLLRDGGSTQHQHNFNPRTPRGVRLWC